MKQRIITGLIFFLVLVPLLVVDALLPVFEVVAAILACAGAWEMIWP